MVQIQGNTIQERFVSAVSGLKLRFPGTVIAKKTGYNKGTVSAYLEKKEPSEAFIKTFCQQFGIEFDLIWTGPPLEIKKEEGEIRAQGLTSKEIPDRLSQAFIDQAKAIADQAEANKIQAIANKENAEAINKLASAIEKMGLNFGTILSTQDSGFGLVAELVNRQVRNDAKGNEEKAKSDLDEIAQRIGPGLGLIARKGIGADGHNEGNKNP